MTIIRAHEREAPAEMDDILERDDDVMRDLPDPEPDCEPDPDELLIYGDGITRRKDAQTWERTSRS